MHLYFWLGEIQKIIRKSPRDIRAILERSSLSPSSRAYQMLEEGSSPTHVAITLDIREEEVNEYYRDYWSLNGIFWGIEIYVLIPLFLHLTIMSFIMVKPVFT